MDSRFENVGKAILIENNSNLSFVDVNVTYCNSLILEKLQQGGSIVATDSHLSLINSKISNCIAESGGAILFT
jgi:hypothetical protein